jgi:hypothetical protein
MVIIKAVKMVYFSDIYCNFRFIRIKYLPIVFASKDLSIHKERHMRKQFAASFVLALLLFCVPAFAQNPLLGTWETVSITMDGKEMPPPSLPNGVQSGIQHWILSADGFYAMVHIPKGRPQLTTPQDQWTKEDWQNRYMETWAQYGSYSISGDKLTMRRISAIFPPVEGTEVVSTFHKDGADLVLISTGPGGAKAEVRLRHPK